MVSIKPTSLAGLVDSSIGAWPWNARVDDKELVQVPMLATCVDGDHRIWLVNEVAGQAWPCARAQIVGNLVPDLRFEDHISREVGYSDSWRWWVRAMFVPRALEHAPACPARPGCFDGSDMAVEGSMPTMTTVGTFRLGAEVLAVEWHPEGIRVTGESGQTEATMRFKPGRVLDEAAPGGTAPLARLQTIQELTAGVLESAAADGRGPWAQSGTPKRQVPSPW